MVIFFKYAGCAGENNFKSQHLVFHCSDINSLEFSIRDKENFK